MTTSPTAPAVACPRCAEPTVTTGLPRPWCPSCDWNLDQTTPVVVGWRWLDRRLHRVAFGLTESQFTALAGEPLSPGAMTAARTFTMAAALVLLAGVLAIAALGVRLLFLDFFGVSTVLGALLIGVAVVLRPRLGRLSDVTAHRATLERGRAPELFALVERVAAMVGAPMPQVLVLDAELNAFTATVGVRRTRVLCLGLPLWATLEPQERVALLGHELGHFVNGDVRRGPLVLVAETTLGRVADLFDIDGLAGRRGLVELIASFLTRSLGRLVSITARTLQTFLVWTSQRDSQRAEYLADEMAARAAGTDAAVALADHLVMMSSIDTVVRREARAGNGPAAWRDAARVARANLAGRRPVLRRLTRHTQVSLYASHPPSGLRAEMIERRPRQEATIILDESADAAIDAELIAYGKRIARELAQ